jgi:hypothetical protein
MPSTAIGVFCYKRPEKLKISIEALLKNPECPLLDIVFFADGYKNENDKRGVEATREYIDSIKGFKNIYKHYREKNYSTGPNFFDGLTYLSNNYDQFIIVEDDLVVTSNYLVYMLNALQFYKDEQSVFCISGFVFPLKANNYPYDTVMCNRFCSYGWATWSNRMKNIRWHKNELIELLHASPGFKYHLNKEGWDLYRMLKKQISGKISTWDIQMQVEVARRNLKVVYPLVSKTKNIGFDNQSTNTFGIDYLKTPQDDGMQRKFNFCPAYQKASFIQKQIKRPYGLKALISRKIINSAIKAYNNIQHSLHL